MKVVSVKEAGVMKIEDRELPVLSEKTDVLVQVTMVGICGSDLHIYHGSNPLATYPRVIGHEVTGVVAAVADGVDRFAVGDQVVLEPIRTCGKCYACRTGRQNVCQELEVYGVHRDGGMQEFIVVPMENLHKINVPAKLAVLAEPFTIGAQACWRGEVQKGDTVLIQGAGPIGICCLKVAKILGATVYISDLSEERLKFAKASGADEIINVKEEDPLEAVMKFTSGEGANVVIDAVCLPQTFELSVQAASVAGRVVVLGFDEKTSNISQLPITKRELTIVGSRLQTNQFPKVVQWLENGSLDVSEMITHEFSVEEVEEAFRFIENNPNEVRKAVIKFS